MNEKIYMILDSNLQFYCYLILKSNLEDYEINNLVKKAYHQALIDENNDFTIELEKELKKLKNIKIISLVYENLKYICV
ncbi:MAG: hypothetical protein IJZ36_04880 [Bacilli bacterium]|nr:hypothetical protein [Bacilli bacterium]